MTRNAPILVMTLAFLAAGPAFAQSAGAPPSEAQLQNPGTSIAAEMAMPERASPAKSAGDPCPAPQAAATGTPDDLAKIQEEIDRFTLCVQRAQLLERLNETALKNQASEDVALGFGPMTAGIAAPQQNALAPLPASALAGADVTPIAATGQPVPAAAQPAAAPKQESPAPQWTIREISGSGSNVYAKLVSPEGDEVRVRSGAKLPDGKVVVRVSPSGVTVREGKGTKSLEWARS